MPIETGNGDSNFIISSTGHLLILQARCSYNYTKSLIYVAYHLLEMTLLILITTTMLEAPSLLTTIPLFRLSIMTTISLFRLADTANYSCVAANTARQRTSPPALVTVYSEFHFDFDDDFNVDSAVDVDVNIVDVVCCLCCQLSAVSSMLIRLLMLMLSLERATQCNESRRYFNFGNL